MRYRTDIINFLIKKFNFSDYLEIGVRNPNDNFNKIEIPNKDGVDPDPYVPCKYQMPSDEFFRYHISKKYDIIFIDGFHSYGQSLKDIKNSLEALNDGGFIVVHDCNPPSEFFIRSYEQFLKDNAGWTGDVFKSIIDLRKNNKDLNVFVVDIDYGCGVITKRDINKIVLTPELPNIEDINKISWEYFSNNRTQFLNLVNVNFLKNI